MALGGTDLNLLVALQALLEEENVTHAGARVGMGQPAMSAALARLRRHFKDELLVRVGREYQLTPLARSLLPAVQEASRAVEDALGISDEFDPLVSTRRFTVSSSDFAASMLSGPLRRRLAGRAPYVTVTFTELPADIQTNEHTLLRHDAVIGPLGFGILGESELLFREHFVCVADPANPMITDARVTLPELADLPHAVTTFGANTLTPVDRMFGQLGLAHRVHVMTVGWLVLPMVVPGTNVVSVVPKRLARRLVSSGRLGYVEAPLEDLELPEAMWWHRSHADDPGHRWFLDVLREVGAEIEAA